MKILTTTLISLCLLGSSVAFADILSFEHYDVKQDELWHGGETAAPHTSNAFEHKSTKHYDVKQEELWFGGETAVPHTFTAPENKSTKHYDVEQEEFWFGG